MKMHMVTLVLVVVMLHDLFGKIINGYERDVEKARLSIAHLRQLLSANPDYTESHKDKLNDMIAQLKDILAYHQLTDTLLARFRAIAPDLYATIDTLKDHRKRSIDVYIKFMPVAKARIKSYGAVMLAVIDEKDHLCTSVYGEGSVSVTIRLLNNSLAILSHEFGHLQYMVPNLPKYLRYYHWRYKNSSIDEAVGHECDDIGGRNALKFENRFRQRYRRYLQDENAKVAPFALIRSSRALIEQQTQYDSGFATAVYRPGIF